VALSRCSPHGFGAGPGSGGSSTGGAATSGASSDSEPHSSGASDATETTGSTTSGGLEGATGNLVSTSGSGGSSESGTSGTDAGVLATADAGALTTGDAMTGGGTTVVDGPTAQAFNPQTGTLNVNYSEYMPKEDIVYNSANTNPLYGLTVGNGRVGAIVWSQNGITMQVSGVDTSEQTAYSAGLVNLATTPGMDAGYSHFQQRLSLYDGLLTTRYDSNRTVTVFGQPNSEVIGIHVSDTRTNVSGITVDLSLWDLSNLENADVPNLSTWQAVSTYADATGAGISRGQADPNHFGYTLAATVDGASFSTQVVSGSDVRLTIMPSNSYTIWIATATRLNALNNDSVAQAKSLLANVKSAGYTATLAQYQAFWHAFWAKSFVQYSNAAGDADYLENAYDLSTYMIAAGGYGNYPFHFINGVFRATQDKTKWSNAYWYWNQRDVYNSFLASDHPDMMNVFNNMYSRNQSALESFTMTHFGFGGLWVPETMGWNGNADGTVGSDFTKNIFSTGTEAAENMYGQYQYTGDANYLSQTVYPFIKGVVTFYQNKLSYDSGSGQYYMASSNAHETYWNVKDAITDLAAVRSLFPIAIQTAQALNMDTQLTGQWQKILSNLVPYPTDGTVYLPHDPPTVKPSNGENVACEIIWPYSVTGLGYPDYQMAVATWKARPFPYGNVWANDAVQAARLGLGDDANQGMKTMLQKYQNYPNGMTNNTNGVFEYLGVHLSAMNESLLQSYNGQIRVFPALPTDSTMVTRFTLAAKGGFLVTSEWEGGEVKYIGLKSLQGNSATVVNPWSTGTALQVRNLATGAVALSSSDATLKLDTAANGIYVVERTAKPLSSYTYAYLTGTPNQGEKVLTGSPSTTLGVGAAPAGSAGN
jgi:alpha-L-fucosidase 2